MIALLQTIIAFGAITLWLWRGERLVREYIASLRAASDAARAAQVQAEQIPDDLLAQSQQWPDSWARQQALDHLYELYAKTKDWSKVRGALAAEQGTI